MLLHYTIVVAVVAGRQPMIPWSVHGQCNLSDGAHSCIPVSTLVFANFPSAPRSVRNMGITLVHASLVALSLSG